MFVEGDAPMHRRFTHWRRAAWWSARRVAALLIVLTLLHGSSWAPTTAEAAYYTIDSNLTVSVAVTGAQLDAAVRAIRPDSGLIGLGATFVRVGNQYGINPVYLTAHAAWESSWGTSAIARDKNNLFGWTAYDSCPYTCATTFSSKAASIETVVPVIKANYLTPGGRYYTSYGPTLRGMNVHYATDPNWKNGIAAVMNMLADRIGSAATTPSGLPTGSAVDCTGTGCNGKDPEDTGCSQDAATVASQTVTFSPGTQATSILMELRWSPTCKTNWARARVLSAPAGAAALTLAVYLEDASGQAVAGTQAQATGTLVYGPLWYAPTQKVQACVAVSGPIKGGVCTKPM
jgi:hypothetical protein